MVHTVSCKTIGDLIGRRPLYVRFQPPMLVWVVASLVLTAPAFGQASPWETTVDVLRASFTGPIARGLSLVAIVGGLVFAFGEGQSKRTLAGIVFGAGMPIGAVNFMVWLFRESKQLGAP